MSVRQSASDPTDFALIESITVQFEPGVNRRTVDIFFLNDRVVENDEILKIILLNPKEGILGDLKEATVGIIDDDCKFLLLVIF